MAAPSGDTHWAATLPTGWQLAIAWGQFTAGVAILAGFRCRIAAGLVVVLTAGQMLWWYGPGLFRLPLSTLEPVVIVLLMGLALLFLGAGGLAVGARPGGKSSGVRAAKKR